MAAVEGEGEKAEEYVEESLECAVVVNLLYYPHFRPSSLFDISFQTELGGPLP